MYALEQLLVVLVIFASGTVMSITVIEPVEVSLTVGLLTYLTFDTKLIQVTYMKCGPNFDQHNVTYKM